MWLGNDALLSCVWSQPCPSCWLGFPTQFWESSWYSGSHSVSSLHSKKGLCKFTCNVCRWAKLQVTLPAKLPAQNDTCDLPRIRYLEFTCKLKQQYIKYVDFDVKETFKNSDWSLDNIPQWKIRRKLPHRQTTPICPIWGAKSKLITR